MDILGIGNILSGIIKPAGDIIDDLTTSDEERLEAKRKLTEIIVSAEAVAQKEVSERWTADMQSGNWLAANIRPLSLVFLTAVFALLSVTDGNIGDFTIGDAYKPIYQTLLLTVYGAYFAGRSIEKIKGKSDPIRQK
jgi:hypothetical protein|tara:strand:+ start:116 stop:526 length:411 start_codon:yes stop_codon:yes gene_type:complete